MAQLQWVNGAGGAECKKAAVLGDCGKVLLDMFFLERDNTHGHSPQMGN